MRLFVSINFDEPTKQKILVVQQRLRAMGRGRFTTEENLHLTLAFLGEVPEDRVGELKAILANLSFEPLHLRFERVGCFRNESELWWLGLAEEPALLKLQRDLTEGLAEAGFRTEKRRFRPHITLARDMRLGCVETNDLLPEPFETVADCVCLMQSNYPARELRYTELARATARN